MSTRKTTGVAPDVMADLQEAADRAAQGLGDLDAARKAAAQVDRLREQNRRRYGEEAIGVSIIRAFRGPLPE